jgi:hypothetical protein
MRQVTYILIIILIASCGQRNENGSANQSAVLPIDTLIADNYVLSFENADSFAITDIYGDLNYRTQLTDTIGNWHNKAAKIQLYLSDKFGNYFFTADTTLVLQLSNGKTESFALWDNQKGEGYNFEYYLDKIDYYLLRVQFGEGNCWMLVNRKNGFKKYISGLPYVSNDNKRIITVNTDLETGYSFNGLELISILTDSLRTEFSKETEWGPTDVKWINENQFFLKREHFHIDGITSTHDNIIDYKLVTIEKKTSR